MGLVPFQGRVAGVESGTPVDVCLWPPGRTLQAISPAVDHAGWVQEHSISAMGWVGTAQPVQHHGSAFCSSRKEGDTCVTGLPADNIKTAC